MTVVRRKLAAPLAGSLAAAQAALLAQPQPYAPEEWELPAGALAGPLELGAEGRSLALVGAPGATVALSGALTIRGASVRVERVTFTAPAGDPLVLRGAAIEVVAVALSQGSLDAAGARVTVSSLRVVDVEAPVAVALRGEQVTATGVEVRARGSATGERVGVAIAADAEAAASDVRVSGVTAGRAIGLRIAAPRVRLSGVAVATIAQAAAAVAAADGLDAAGVLATASEEIDATSLRVDGVSGDAAAGVRLVCAGAAYLVDLDVRRVTGASAATGVFAVAGARLRLRGFDVREVEGGRAAGVFAFGARGIEAQVGRAEQVLAAGGDAAGMRLLGGVEGEVTARDLAVEAIGRRAPAPAGPLADWQQWTLDARVALLAALPGPELALPPDPGGAAVTGLHLAASLSPFDPAALSAEPPALRLEGALVRRIGGAALHVEGDLRSAIVRGVEIWAAAAAGLLASELVLAAELTLHALGEGLALDPGEARLYDTITTRIAAGPSFTVDPSAPRPELGGCFSDVDHPAEDHRVKRLGAVPYRAPGVAVFTPDWALGLVPAAEQVDLALVPSSPLHGEAVPVPGDERGPDRRPFVGAIAPAPGPRVDARDPEPRPAARRVAAGASSPFASYTARDAPSLLALMLGRARAVMPAWDLGGPADFTTVIFELLAERLDHLSYAQEHAVGEGFLDAARRRRSVEDHARALDCAPDPGLSATAMLRFRLTAPASPAARRSFTVPQDTLVANRATDEASIVFATEAPLEVFPELDALPLAEDCPAGATAARLAGLTDDPEIEQVLRGRWLVFAAEGDPHHPGHVVQVTGVARTPEHVEVRWDPRRPLPCAFAAPASDAAPLRAGGDAPVARVLANVVPAHHGVPVARLGDGERAADDRVLGAWRRLLTLEVEGGPGREVPLPLAPVSVRAAGYPRPDEPARRGAAMLRVAVEGDPWRLVDDLALAGPGDEHVVLRPGDDGGSVLRFGDDINGAALPARAVRLDLDLTIGLGRPGNVGADRLGRIVQLGGGGPRDADVAAWLGGLAEGPERDDRLRELLLADNPLPAVGGRDPEPLEHLRYRAPLAVMDGLSAVTAADYERLACDLPEVAAASARVIDAGVRPRVRVTVLLRDDDRLSDAERLRRWAAVRRRLEDVRLLGFDVEAVPPVWVPLDLDVVVEAAPYAAASALRDAVVEAVAGQDGMLDPDVVGLGGDVHLSTLYQTVLAVPGVVGARVHRFRRHEPGAEERLGDGTIAIAAEEVAVVRAPDPSRAGLLTVRVHGGLA